MTGSSWIRQALLALALVAMGVRAAAPPGYMFAPGASGLTVTLCGGETMHVDFAKHDGQPQRNGDSGPCLFAAVAHGAPAPIINPPKPIFVTAIYAPKAQSAPRICQGLAAPPPPSTGPPYFA